MTALRWKAALNITPFWKSVAEQWQRNNNLYEVSSIDMKPLQKMSLCSWEHQGTDGSWARRTCLGNLQMGTRQELFMESTWGLYLCVGLFKWMSAEQHEFKQADVPANGTTPSLCWFWILGNRDGKTQKGGRKSIIYRLISDKSGITQEILSSYRTSLNIPYSHIQTGRALQGVWA